jgi:DNA-directed RNA polymerase specialized sigma24 family protein
MTPLEIEILKDKYYEYALHLTKDVEDAKELISQLISQVYEKKDMFDKANEGGYIEGYLITTVFRLFCTFKKQPIHEELDVKMLIPEDAPLAEATHYIERINRDKRKKKPSFKAYYSTFISIVTMAIPPDWRMTATLTSVPFNMQLSNINKSYNR